MRGSEPLTHYKIQFITIILKQGSDSRIKCLLCLTVDTSNNKMEFWVDISKA